MFPGLHVFEPDVFRWMDPGLAFGLIRETYPRLLRADQPVFGFVTRVRWVTIDTPTSLAAADQTLSRSPFSF
jgi:NDP-sugar pyrophosphorylase family protein